MRNREALQEGRHDTRTDARGNNWRTLWASCCGRQQATIDPLGHGKISNTDYAGRVTHSAVVEDVSSHTNLNDPVDVKTLQEVTTRYDARGRMVARTAWLVPRGAVDSNNAPIAGLDGVAAAASRGPAPAWQTRRFAPPGQTAARRVSGAWRFSFRGTGRGLPSEALNRSAGNEHPACKTGVLPS